MVAKNSLDQFSASDPPNSGARFWATQLAGWALIHAVMFIPTHGLATMLGATTREVLVHSAVSTAFAVPVSSALGWLYMRLPERRLRGAHAIASVLMASLVGSALWTAAQFGFTLATGIGPWLPPQMQGAWYAFPMFAMLRGTTMLGTWSALFLVVLLARRVQVARERAIFASALVHEAQLQLLRSQLNPHFLFNALNSVIGLTSEEPKRAQQMVRDLASLLRHALDGTRSRNATVGDELEFIRLYLRCEKVRFERRLQVDLDVPDELLKRPLPSMLLHPLVENAIKHGMRGKEPLKLRVGGRLEGDRIVLEVANSGDVSTPRRTPQPGTGTGLRSVRERIRAFFPDDGNFELTDGEGWVTARIQYTPITGAVA